MKKIFSILVFTAWFVLNIHGQEQKPKLDESDKIGSSSKSAMFTAECMGLVNNPGTDLKWRPVLAQKPVSFRPETPNKEFIKKAKAEKMKQKALTVNNNDSNEKSTLSVTPVVGTNYDANPNNGFSPLDNSMAISNGGWIVSVTNTTIRYDMMNGNNVYYSSIVSFINDTAITHVCDPVVIYDAGSDRFIFFVQESSGLSTKSKLLIFFSKTNNPQNGWWYYKLTGNPLNDESWFDYPKLAVSTNELYITGNLFYDSGGFNEAVLYQINKTSGYSGTSMSWQYWHNISGSPFTLLPVSYGQGGSYGPGCYLVATDNNGSSNIKLYDLTDDMSSSNEELNRYNISTPSYEFAGDSYQLNTACLLDNGDCRALSGFYLNGIIHFVFHSDIGSGWNGINYNRLTVSTKTNESSLFGLVGTYDYSYPSVVSFASSTTDKSVIINFGRTGSTIYPEVRVVNCDDALNWSGSTLVKSSLSYVSYTSSTQERWGDYTGVSRKHNSASPTVWVCGSYGNSSHRWNQWNAEIHGPVTTGISPNSNQADFKVFPNPVIETFNIEFTLNEKTDLEISVVDVNGKTVKELYKGRALKGVNAFSFNKANLAGGTYFLVIKDKTQIFRNEKIIIAD
ncbi:MAG TPA: T9SS type A sorting domain-containing protein [Bacteroidales bacterium]|nr:T9SS type A sorting domain-containing protein [Bacteroidales bacterium]HNZ42196.1 T9SS type A sorting domain-containing protein [Bacteroidales bacterium]HPB24722.1 T9SS type A sorting domain-containing protein [Bacteroidales bacterium]HPI30269.1 T9SS type A sorting domain-containing protein [Bacteroidales bacterium]HQN15444.1 T9SS type A sorting domain-containing protein [Bacteroidales bacterium]